MIVYLLVATISVPGVPNAIRVVPADRPFYATLAACQRAVATMRNSPPAVFTVACERRTVTREGFAR